jgi:DNA-binding Lrp family transcriptional regulator
MRLDVTDRAILTALQDNARPTNAELADRVHLSASACLRRTRLLDESGLIARIVAILDPRIAGVPGTAYVSVTLDSQGRASLDKFEAAVRGIPEITECYLLAGQHDYLLRVVYRDAADLERIHADILTPLPGVVRVQSQLTLRTVKRSTKLPI